jgi:hypothetical protein
VRGKVAHAESNSSESNASTLARQKMQALTGLTKIAFTLTSTLASD